AWHRRFGAGVDADAETGRAASRKRRASFARSSTSSASRASGQRGAADFVVPHRVRTRASRRMARGGSPGRRAMKRLALLLAASALPALAAANEPLSLLGISAGKGGASLSVPMQILVLLTLLTLLPGAIMAMTPFLRISIVLHFLRQALGTQT